ncbi:zinc finger domain-containing protein [Streptomyces albidoflavus]|uniref:zinc finger domain-containing protein n=1 Tax=Streptomyces albidoflavus TaxID=1886 RepID=UPI00101E7697|nr:cell surface glycoprotein [Streptomyces albidoflavus]RZD85262.1 cell surface glycoprotein [Streptomyces albidoflavus]RZE01572.1 cell surface glycoprotein [Streptomyces albidoflavus]
MKRPEIVALLAFVDRLDPGRAPQSKAAARERLEQWSILLDHVPATAQHPDGPDRSWDASRVAARHIATTPYPIKPSDIGGPWETYRRDVIGRHWDPAPAVDPDDVTAYRAALRRTRQAVAVGQLPPTPQHAIEGRPSPIRAERDAEAARRLAVLGAYVPRTVRDQLAAHRPHRAARERLAAADLPDPLDVECTWCGAIVGQPCRARRINPRTDAIGYRAKAYPHPARVQDAQARHASRQQQEETAA